MSVQTAAKKRLCGNGNGVGVNVIPPSSSRETTTTNVRHDDKLPSGSSPPAQPLPHGVLCRFPSGRATGKAAASGTPNAVWTTPMALPSTRTYLLIATAVFVNLASERDRGGGRFHESSTHSSQATDPALPAEVSRDLDHVQPRTLTNPDRRQTRVSSHLLLLCVQCITKDRLQVSGWIPTHLSGVGRRIVVVPPCLLLIKN